MRMVIETSESERDAIKKFAAAHSATYSDVFRAMFRLALTGKVPDEALRAALSEPRAQINVTLNAAPSKKDEPVKPKWPDTTPRYKTVKGKRVKLEPWEE